MLSRNTMPIEFHTTQLPNGLTVLAETDREAHTSAVGFFVKTGSRDEIPALMGVSHFLEHMMFKGTPRRSAADVNREFDEIGADYNASTSQETTNYYAHVLPRFLPAAVDLLADMLRPALRTDDFEMEKNVILEEIGMYNDRPFWIAYEQAMERYYAEQSLGFRVLGTTQTITDLTAEQMRSYFEHRYSPDNMVVSFAGRVDFNAAVEQVTRLCAGWQPTGTRRLYAPVRPNACDLSLTRDSVNMHYLVGVAPGPSRQDDDRYAAAVLAHILGDSDNGRLYWELIEPGLAEEADFAHHPYDQTGTFMTYISCPPENAGKVEKKLWSALARAAEGLKDDEVRRAASKIAMDLTLQDERPAGRMMAMGGQWLYQGRYITTEETLNRVQAVDVAALRKLIEQYPFSPRTVVRMGP